MRRRGRGGEACLGFSTLSTDESERQRPCLARERFASLSRGSLPPPHSAAFAEEKKTRVPRISLRSPRITRLRLRAHLPPSLPLTPLSLSPPSPVLFSPPSLLSPLSRWLPGSLAALVNVGHVCHGAGSGSSEPGADLGLRAALRGSCSGASGLSMVCRAGFGSGREAAARP